MYVYACVGLSNILSDPTYITLKTILRG